MARDPGARSGSPHRVWRARLAFTSRVRHDDRSVARRRSSRCHQRAPRRPAPCSAAALATEGEGIARASRVARLCGRLLDLAPGDAWAALALARALVALGDMPAARQRLAGVDHVAPASAAAAEAQVVRLSIDDPRAEIEVRSVLRAAQSADSEHLADVAARARRLATLHHAWPGWLAAAVAERRQQRWAAARGALHVALELAPGATRRISR